MQVDDAETIANLIRREPDASFGHSRFPYSAIAFAKLFGEMAEKAPDPDIELAVVLRETGELIGETGLFSIDWIARTAESASWLYRAADRGKGYGSEAKLLLLDYAFEFFFLAEDGIRVLTVTGVQTCALPIYIVCGGSVRAAEEHDIRPGDVHQAA